MAFVGFPSVAKFIATPVSCKRIALLFKLVVMVLLGVINRAINQAIGVFALVSPKRLFFLSKCRSYWNGFVQLDYPLLYLRNPYLTPSISINSIFKLFATPVLVVLSSILPKSFNLIKALSIYLRSTLLLNIT